MSTSALMAKVDMPTPPPGGTAVPACFNSLITDVASASAEPPRTELEQRILSMARAVQHKPFRRWPAWSTGERLMVALVLDDTAALSNFGFRVLEAVDRVELTPNQLMRIAREVC
ncbi:hypothetical protein [Ottowia testudinis]|uniref:Uncharacterized protein n=1 Tax=Ottowia testudinis TaxID=2816950 RepID=A0A975CGB7_9BURK|nr:hypothetical protein [Ottowia testudinis]QTD44576.1 hypothetical protein J1M35_15970 [Ottowia testudinis]